MTHFTPLWEGLTEQWLNEQWPNVGYTHEHLLDPAVAGALRLRPGASLPPQKIARQCSLSISGIMENCNTHLAPGFTLNNLAPGPANVAASRGLLGSSGFNSLYQMSFQQWNPVWPKNLPDPTLFLGIHLSHQSTARYRAAELQPLRSPCLQS